MNLHSLYGLECIINRFIKYLQCCGHAECTVWDSCGLTTTCSNKAYTLVRWVFQTHQNKIPASKRQASQMGCEQRGGKKKLQSCWAYVSFCSLIQATKAGKQRADKGQQGAFRSVGRNAFWISEGRSQLVKSQWCCWQDEPAEHLDKECIWGMIFQKKDTHSYRVLNGTYVPKACPLCLAFKHRYP